MPRELACEQISCQKDGKNCDLSVRICQPILKSGFAVDIDEQNIQIICPECKVKGGKNHKGCCTKGPPAG